MSDRQKLSGIGTSEYEDKRSRFLGQIWPVSDEAEAKKYLDSTRKKYPDARHHCWAWIMPDGAFRWSDDGEPGGTAGAPMLDILKNAHVYGAMCVVTRYFGGVLLGSGGLVRAYSKAASLALSDAGTEPDPEKTILSVTSRWENLDRIHRLIREYGGALLSSDYESDPSCVLMQAELLAENAEAFAARLTDVTGGQDSAKVFSKK